MNTFTNYSQLKIKKLDKLKHMFNVELESNLKMNSILSHLRPRIRIGSSTGFFRCEIYLLVDV